MRRKIYIGVYTKKLYNDFIITRTLGCVGVYISYGEKRIRRNGFPHQFLRQEAKEIKLSYPLSYKRGSLSTTTTQYSFPFLFILLHIFWGGLKTYSQHFNSLAHPGIWVLYIFVVVGWGVGGGGVEGGIDPRRVCVSYNLHKSISTSTSPVRCCCCAQCRERG